MTERRAAPVVGTDALVRAQHDLLERLAAAGDLADASRELAEVAVRHAGADAAAVSLGPGRGPAERLAATDPELLGRTVGPGVPGVGPWAEVPAGAAIVVQDTRTDRRWPAWAVATSRLQLRSALFVGLPALSGRWLVLELYSRRTDAFPPEVSAGARVLAAHAGVALQQVDRIASLNQALHTRGLIGEAQGILMERYGLTGDQAMTYLRRQSQETHLRVRDLAADLVARREVESRGPHDDPDS